MQLNVVILSFIFLLKNCLAVFQDEAYVIDWQMQRIGDYDCVTEDKANKRLYILSKNDDTSRLSVIDELSGKVVLRKDFDYAISDLSMDYDAAQLYLMKPSDGITVFNLTSLFEISGAELPSQFASSCHPPNLDAIKIENGELFVKHQEDSLIIKLPENFKKVKYLYTDDNETLRVLFVDSDEKYYFYSFDENEFINSWTKDESIANIVSQVFIDIKSSSLDTVAKQLAEENESSNIFEAYLVRIKKNINRFVTLLEENGYNPGQILTKLVTFENDEDRKAYLIEQDIKFGFLKCLIVLDKNGKLSGIDSITGDILWSKKTNLSDAIFLHFNEETNQLFAFDKSGLYEIFDVSNGIIVKQIEEKAKIHGGQIKDIKPLGETSNNFYVKFFNDQRKVISLNNADSTTLENTYITDHDSNGVYGFIVKSDGNLQSTWSHAVNDKEEILAFASRSNDEVVNVGSILGDRTVLYKFLYPNMAAFVVHNKDSNKLFLKVIDTLTGQIIHIHAQDDIFVPTAAPVSIVFGEHWVIYSYFSIKPIPEQKLVVVELYESLTPNESKYNSSMAIDALEGGFQPAVISKSYFFPEPIQAMALSYTKFGITTKSIIIQMKNGQVTFLPKTLLNARRKPEEEMTEVDKKEFMASPYIPAIPINDNFIISHDRDIISGPNAKLVSVATNLESSSQVCLIGHDIFCTRITPSGPFDVISPSFEKVTLVTTVVVLIAVCFALRPFVNTKKLKDAWLIRG